MDICFCALCVHEVMQTYSTYDQIDNGQRVQPPDSDACVCALIQTITNPPNPFKFLTYTEQKATHDIPFLFSLKIMTTENESLLALECFPGISTQTTQTL